LICFSKAFVYKLGVRGHFGNWGVGYCKIKGNGTQKLHVGAKLGELNTLDSKEIVHKGSCQLQVLLYREKSATVEPLITTVCPSVM